LWPKQILVRLAARLTWQANFVNWKEGKPGKPEAFQTLREIRSGWPIGKTNHISGGSLINQYLRCYLNRPEVFIATRQ